MASLKMKIVKIRLKKRKNTNFQMGQYIQDNGEVQKGMVMEYKYGLMEPSMREIGKTIKHTEKGNFIMLKVIYMKEIGFKIKYINYL
jgi:hypothetical protein